MNNPIHASLAESEIAALVQRMELLPQLVRRQQEELIVEQVPLPPEWMKEQRQSFWLARALAKCWKTAAGMSPILISPLPSRGIAPFRKATLRSWFGEHFFGHSGG